MKMKWRRGLLSSWMFPTDLVPRKNSANACISHLETSSGISNKLREAGWIVVHGLVPESDIESEGRRLLCSHFWVEDEVAPFPGPTRVRSQIMPKCRGSRDSMGR
ncbi:MAG: hypothetical protein CM1200mP4_3960 [Rhodospirillaceae bacterium]|nr:MAG: hypothetical protein CM1200mP4_3960 [Rhodospirillaceae bacterium]